jgi:hypothetical protein
MLPSENQRRNLARMTEILSANWKASMLAESLWEFYNCQLYCTIRPNDAAPNRHRIYGVTGPATIGRIQVFISIRRNERQEEGLLHELLHANLIPLGYPRFWVNERPSEKSQLAGGIINLADHIVIEPIYLSFGYSRERFLAPSRSLSDQEKRVAADLQEIAGNLVTPTSYLTHVSAYLRSYDIKFEPLWLADTIVTQRADRGDATQVEPCRAGALFDT